MVKPFSPSELIARVRAVLRRANPERASEVLTYADLSMDLEEHRVYRGEELVRLGPTEFRLLRVFLEKPGRVYSREQLLDRVWTSISAACARRSTPRAAQTLSARCVRPATHLIPLLIKALKLFT